MQVLLPLQMPYKACLFVSPFAITSQLYYNYCIVKVMPNTKNVLKIFENIKNYI